MIGAMAIANGSLILLPAAAVPLFICYRAYASRWGRLAGVPVSR